MRVARRSSPVARRPSLVACCRGRHFPAPTAASQVRARSRKSKIYHPPALRFARAPLRAGWLTRPARPPARLTRPASQLASGGSISISISSSSPSPSLSAALVVDGAAKAVVSAANGRPRGRSLHDRRLILILGALLAAAATAAGRRHLSRRATCKLARQAKPGSRKRAQQRRGGRKGLACGALSILFAVVPRPLARSLARSLARRPRFDGSL